MTGWRTTALSTVACLLVLAGCAGEGGTTTGTGDSDWPNFGRTPTRTHYLPAPDSVNPPLKESWSFSDRVLIEFPPAVNDGIAYLADKYGNVRALRLNDQEVLWDIQNDKRNVGPPSDVTAPAYYQGRVYVAFYNGTLAALDSSTGEVAWKRDLGSFLESSPVVVDGRLFIGTDKGDLFAIEAESGRTVWRYKAPSPVKSSPSVSEGHVLFGDYSGTMYSLDTGTGNLVWSSDTAGVGSGGGFYSSPAIGFGKVYAGRDDGTVFGFDIKNGRRAWSYRTMGPVYGSPAIAKVRGTPATVYIGSYDTNLYALDAASGKKRWSFEVGGEVPGTATVIGHTVYTSNFRTTESIGIDVRTQKKTFSFDSPGYTPMISDGKNLYLIGYFTLHGFEPDSG